MKRFFKRTIACLIAVLMVVSSLPFTALTANAADSSTVSKKISVKSYGLFTNETGNRWGGTYANVINDATENMFDIGFVNFDISGFTATEFDQISPVYYNFFAKRTSGKRVPLHVMYPTKNQAYFAGDSNVVWNTSGNAKKIDASLYKDIWSNPINTNGRANSAKQIFGLQNLQTITLANQGDSRNCSVDIVEAIKAAKAARLSYVTIVFMLANGEAAGDFTDASGESYSDTSVYYFGQNGNPDTFALDVNVTTSLDADKQYIASMIDKGAPTYNYLVNDSSRALSNQANYMKNIVYAGNWNTICSTYSDKHTDDTKNNFRFNSYGMNNVIAIYDSENADIRIPVTVGTSDNNVKASTVYQYIGYDHVALNNGGAFSLASEWTLCSSTTSFDDSTAINHKSFSSDINTNITNRAKDDYENTRYHLKDNRQFKNYLKFAPNDTFNNNYYVTMNKLDYDVQADISYCWGVLIYSWAKSDDYKIASSGNVNYSVINYLPLKNLLNDEKLKSNYRMIKANESKYVASSLDNYYKALAALYKFNLTDGLTEETVAAKASEMDTLIKNYEKYKNPKIQFTFEKVDGSKVTVEAQDSETARLWAVTENNAPNTADTKKTSKDAEYHSWTTYSWPTEPDANRVFKEVGTENTEKHTLNKEHICTGCGEFIADETAYNDAVTEAASIVNDEQYTAESRAQYSAVVEKAKADKKDAAKQSDIDQLVAQILSAKTLLRKTQCVITFNSLSDDATEPTLIETEPVEYGTQRNFKYTPTNGESVKAWIVTTDKGSTVTTVKTLADNFTLYVTKEAEVTVCTVSNPSTDTAKYSKVVFLGKNSRVVAVKYLKENVDLPTDSVPAPNIPFYSFAGWDKATVTGTGSDIYVTATYTPEQTAEDQMCKVYFNGFENGYKAYTYNSYVRLENTEEGKQYALAADEAGVNILTYLDDTSFFAPKTDKIYVVEVTRKEAKVAITGSFAEDVVENGTTMASAVFNCKFYLPTDCELIEWGAEISANGRTKVVKGDSLSSHNEYTIRMKVSKTSSIQAFTGRAYVTYRDSDRTVKTIYSDPVEQSLNK
ncbi:MAG: hypothetical protein PUE48_06250 [Eubacterium coprostanoligenes]|uniref:hypothetical protein n=1 Tax=Eubacterium coprostanoligenes TaxID=290054 RepID=UPI002409D5F1|nr:hypothetical protein [Eubacterium coprostanoligenes]MDD6665924.1 hypothetical protein [Eubacterium coprostanoligenes]